MEVFDGSTSAMLGLNNQQPKPLRPMDIGRMRLEQKLQEAIQRSLKHLPHAMRSQVQALFTPQTAGIMAATLVVIAGSYAVGIGFIATAIFAAVGAVAFGFSAFDFCTSLVKFAKAVKTARTERDLEAAAKLFADSILVLGVSAVAALLTRSAVGALGRQVVVRARLGRTFGSDAKTLAKCRKKIIKMPQGKMIGPEAMERGRSLNLTKDCAFIVKPNERSFVLGAHSTKDSLFFTADYDGAVTLPARVVAIRMFKAGYRGGDITCVSCELGQNLGLVRALRKELTKQLKASGIDTPVGILKAPTQPIQGNLTISSGGWWTRFGAIENSDNMSFLGGA